MTMTERPNENLIKDATKKPETGSGMGFKMVSSPELKKLAESIGVVRNVIDHNQPVELDHLQQIREIVKKLTVDFYGEKLTMKELERMPNLKEDEIRKNKKIWEEIKRGNLDNTKEVSLITSEIAEILSRYHGSLNLNSLKFLSNQTAEHLSSHQNDLNFRDLAFLSDQAAEHLSRHEGSLNLLGLKFISDQAAEYLSRHQGDLILSGLTSLSDKAAEYLSHHQGKLFLSGLTSLSDKIAEQLSRHQGALSLNITSISDKVAEHLSHLKGRLFLNRLTSLSDQAAKYLERHEEETRIQENIEQDKLRSPSNEEVGYSARHKGIIRLFNFSKNRKGKRRK